MTSPIFAEAAEEWARMRLAYGDYLESHMAAAVEATNGYMLNPKGNAWDVLNDAGVECLLLAPAGEGLAREEMAEVHEFLDVVPEVLSGASAQPGAEAPLGVARVVLPDTSSRSFVTASTDGGGADADDRPGPARVSTGLMAPVPDEW